MSDCRKAPTHDTRVITAAEIDDVAGRMLNRAAMSPEAQRDTLIAVGCLRLLACRFPDGVTIDVWRGETVVTYGDAARLADRLTRRQAVRSQAEQIEALQNDCEIAGLLIRALLRQTHSSDAWTLSAPERPANGVAGQCSVAADEPSIACPQSP